MAPTRPATSPGLQWILLAIGVVAGLLLAYLDSLPRWDDSGIIAGGLLLVSGLLTLLGHRQPWLIALAVGLWVPLRAILTSHDLTLVAVLVFPLLGAYAGFFVRQGLNRAGNSA